MNDLTLLYYTCNRVGGWFGGYVRRQIASVTTEPIVAISQNSRPHDVADISADFSNRLVCAPIEVQAEPSIAQVYRNILMAAKIATTPYVAMIEDDCLYVAEHFAYRPPLDTFAYNEHRLVLTRRLSADGRSREAVYFFNPRTQMAMGICSRELLIETLEQRFAAHPNPPLDTTVAKNAGYGEPGRYEKNLGLPPRKLTRFKWASQPNITVNHSFSLMGRRAIKPHFETCTDVEPWGNATELWNRIHG